MHESRRIGRIEIHQLRIRRWCAGNGCRGRGGSGRRPVLSVHFTRLRVGELGDAGGLRRPHARSADAPDSSRPLAVKRLVANQLRGQTQARLARQQNVVGIVGLEFLPRLRRSAGTWRRSRSGGSMCFMLQPRSTNSVASQSSSSGCDGLSPCVPKSSDVRTMPRPKNSCQMRFTATRAVSGFSRETSQRASASR